MTGLQLDVAGDLPAGVTLEPLMRVVTVLNQQSDVLQLPDGIINVTFVDDVTIRDLNRDYSGNDYATDVLSFNYLESGEAIEGVIGEMVVSYETAQIQATEAGTTLQDETALLCLHGMLHISGYDHQDADGQERMQALQQRIMSEAGLTYREFVWQD